MRKLKNVVVEITNKCNLKCKHCSVDGGNILDRQLTKEEIFNIIDQLHQLKVERLGITGGEPFCDNNLFEYLKYAKDKIPIIAISTNGYFITEEIIGKLKQLGIYKFAISLDGTKDYHNSFRGDLKAFDKAINAIKLMTAAGMDIKVKSVVNKENTKYILQLMKITNELNIKRHEIFPVSPLGRAEINNCLTSKEYLEFIKKAIITIKSLDTLNINYQLKPVYQEDSLFLGVDENIKHKSLNYRCDAFKDSLEITSQGDVIGCSFVRDMVGNIRDSTIERLWESNEAIRLYNLIHNHNKLGECNDCNRNDICNGGCYANREGLKKDRYCFVRSR